MKHILRKIKINLFTNKGFNDEEIEFFKIVDMFKIANKSLNNRIYNDDGLLMYITQEDKITINDFIFNKSPFYDDSKKN